MALDEPGETFQRLEPSGPATWSTSEVLYGGNDRRPSRAAAALVSRAFTSQDGGKTCDPCPEHRSRTDP